MKARSRRPGGEIDLDKGAGPLRGRSHLRRLRRTAGTAGLRGAKTSVMRMRPTMTCKTSGRSDFLSSVKARRGAGETLVGLADAPPDALVLGARTVATPTPVDQSCGLRSHASMTGIRMLSSKRRNT